jgi:hypothetical protein
MKFSGLILLAFTMLFSSLATAQTEEETPKLDGRVTRVGSAQNFDVTGVHVELTAQTEFWIVPKSSTGRKVSEMSPYLGADFAVFGKKDKKRSVPPLKNGQYQYSSAAFVARVNA